MPKIHKVNVHDAKSNLSKLVEQVLAGDEVILARNGQALVRLVPVEEGLRRLGLHATELSDAEADEAMRPLEPNEQALWETDLLPDT
jgi:prevent-host-death family protein